jgi:hypothetical protein
MLVDLRAQLQQALALVQQLIQATQCADCGRTARVLTPWEEDGQVVAWLGPTCLKRRADAAAPDRLPLEEGQARG